MPRISQTFCFAFMNLFTLVLLFPEDIFIRNSVITWITMYFVHNFVHVCWCNFFAHFKHFLWHNNWHTDSRKLIIEWQGEFSFMQIRHLMQDIFLKMNSSPGVKRWRPWTSLRLLDISVIYLAGEYLMKWFLILMSSRCLKIVITIWIRQQTNRLTFQTVLLPGSTSKQLSSNIRIDTNILFIDICWLKHIHAFHR